MLNKNIYISLKQTYIGWYSTWQQTLPKINTIPIWPRNQVNAVDFISLAQITLLILKFNTYWGGFINWNCRET